MIGLGGSHVPKVGHGTIPIISHDAADTHPATELPQVRWAAQGEPPAAEATADNVHATTAFQTPNLFCGEPTGGTSVHVTSLPAYSNPALGWLFREDSEGDTDDDPPPAGAQGRRYAPRQ